MFRLQTKEIKFFGEIAKLLKNISPDEFYVWVEGNNLKLGCIDPSHVVIAEFSLNERYISMNGELKDRMLVSDTKDFANLIKLAKKGDVFTMDYAKGVLRGIISDDTEANVYVSADFNIELNDELPPFPNTSEFHRVSASLEDRDKALKYQIQFCGEIVVSVTDNSLMLNGERKGRKVKSEITLLPEQDTVHNGVISSKINKIFIGTIEKTLRIADSVHLYMKERSPLIFQFRLKDGMGKVKYFVSPILKEGVGT